MVAVGEVSWSGIIFLTLPTTLQLTHRLDVAHEGASSVKVLTISSRISDGVKVFQMKVLYNSPILNFLHFFLITLAFVYLNLQKKKRKKCRNRKIEQESSDKIFLIKKLFPQSNNPVSRLDSKLFILSNPQPPCVYVCMYILVETTDHKWHRIKDQDIFAGSGRGKWDGSLLMGVASAVDLRLSYSCCVQWMKWCTAANFPLQFKHEKRRLVQARSSKNSPWYQTSIKVENGGTNGTRQLWLFSLRYSFA